VTCRACPGRRPSLAKTDFQCDLISRWRPSPLVQPSSHNSTSNPAKSTTVVLLVSPGHSLHLCDLISRCFRIPPDPSCSVLQRSFTAVAQAQILRQLPSMSYNQYSGYGGNPYGGNEQQAGGYGTANPYGGTGGTSGGYGQANPYSSQGYGQSVSLESRNASTVQHLTKVHRHRPRVFNHHQSVMRRQTTPSRLPTPTTAYHSPQAQ